ncbi:MAG: hypothetical protein IPM38_05670 [Ignavibacteria bacterium]|nr:hypothetical protein [Ignavibacteria bacterium]
MCNVNYLLFAYHKIDWYGYKAELKDKYGKVQELLEYKDYNKNMGNDYLFEDAFGYFGKYFVEDIVADLIQKFRGKKIKEKMKIISFINESISIKKKNSFKTRFIESLFLIDAICQHIIQSNQISYPSGKGYSEYQERIKAVITYLHIPFKEVGFSYSKTKIKNGKLLWVITDYRNQIAHSNIESNFSWERSFNQYVKVMDLIRRLVLILIEPKHQKIPYPEKLT